MGAEAEAKAEAKGDHTRKMEAVNGRELLATIYLQSQILRLRLYIG